MGLGSSVAVSPNTIRQPGEGDIALGPLYSVLCWVTKVGGDWLSPSVPKSCHLGLWLLHLVEWDKCSLPKLNNETGHMKL